MDPYLIFIYYLTGLTGFSGFIFSKIFSDGVGLSFLIFFWKMRNQKEYPINPVNPVLIEKFKTESIHFILTFRHTRHLSIIRELSYE